jgi:coenzyme F420-reducing hydrogenase alpha subunit
VNAEGSLSVRLTVAGGRVTHVDVISTRPIRAASVLAGHTRDEVLRLVPLLFPVCGAAHAVACARAIESALGTAPDPQLEAARDVACLAEAAVSHVWQLGVTWPEATGAPVDVDRLRTGRKALLALSTALFGAHASVSALRPGAALGDARKALRVLEALVDDLTASEPRLLAEVKRAGRAGFGAVVTRTAARLDPVATGILLAADPAFPDHPELDDDPVDVSTYARQRHSEAVRPVEAEYGRGGLLARLVARWVAARVDAQHLAASFAAFEHESPTSQPPRAPSGSGVGSAETARGPLVYRVQATQAAVHDVRVVSPTDWNFHPRGVLRSGLMDAPDSPTLARDVQWLVLALDPCVPCGVEVHHA